MQKKKKVQMIHVPKLFSSLTLLLSSLSQVILSLEHGLWAPNIHYNIPNADIPALQDGRLQVVTKPTPTKGFFVGINSFGFGGSNAHVILRPHKKKSTPLETCSLVQLVQFCGRTQEAVETLITQSKTFHQHTAFISLLNDISGLPMTSMPFRGYTLINSENDVKEIQRVQSSGRPLWYICSGNYIQITYSLFLSTLEIN